MWSGYFREEHKSNEAINDPLVDYHQVLSMYIHPRGDKQALIQAERAEHVC